MSELGNNKGWTFDTFEAHVNAINCERAKAIDAALVARKEEALHHNGLIDAMKDQQALFVTRGQLAATLIAAMGSLGTVVGILAYLGRGSL